MADGWRKNDRHARCVEKSLFQFMIADHLSRFSCKSFEMAREGPKKIREDFRDKRQT